MGISSQAGQVGFKTQSVKGTYKDPGAASPNEGVFARITSGALGGNRDLLIPDAEIGGTRDVQNAYLGPIAYAGEYNFYAHEDVLPTLFQAALGSGSSSVAGTGGTQVGTHTIVPSASLPWLSIEEKIGNGFDCFHYTDAKANTLHLEADAAGYMMGTVGLAALTQLPGQTPTVVPNWDGTPMIVGTNIVCKWNGVTLPAKSFSWDLNNNLEVDDFRLGSLTLGDMVEKRREVSMGVTIRPSDFSYWRTAVYGGPALTAPSGVSTKNSFQITATSYEVIGTTATFYSIDLTHPFAIMEPFALAVSGDDVMQHDITVRAVAPTIGTPIVTVTVKNARATIA